MHTSNYLKQKIFHQSSHATDHLFENKSEALFQRPGQKSFIEVYYQQAVQQKFPTTATAPESQQNSEFFSVCPSSVDQSSSFLNGDPPPTYDSSPGLIRKELLYLQDIQRIERVSTPMAAFYT